MFKLIKHKVLIIIVALFIGVSNTGKVQINFGAFISNILQDELCFKAAIDAAVSMINEDDTILKDYEVKMNYLDNYGMTGFGISEFFKIHEMDNVLQLLLGPFTEKYAVPIRELSSNMKLPMFEDNGETNQSQRKAIIALLKHFKWNSVSMMYDFQYLNFVQAAKNLKKDLSTEYIHASSVQGFSSRPYFDTNVQMSHLKNQDSRIIIMDMDKWAAPTIFCDAYLNNMTFPRNVFISGNIDELVDNWHKKLPDNTHRCTSQQILSAAEGFIFLKRSDFRLNNGPHRAKRSRSQIWSLIKKFKRTSWNAYLKTNRRWKHKHPKRFPKPTYHKGSARVFDLVYRAALAFDDLLKKHDSKDVLMGRYNDDVKFKRITNAIKTVEFDGVSGKQHHMDLGHEIDHIIYQYRNGTFVEVGFYTPSTDKISFTKGQSLFQGEKVPRDSVLLKKVIIKYKTSTLYTMWGAAIAGIVLSFSLLFINIYYRKKRIIKMSSPNVNNIIILGCILCYSSIILYGFDTRFIDSQTYSLCYAIVCTLSIGFTLSFGGLFSKTWRVYRIFAAARTNRRVAVRDGQLYLLILLLVTIDISILITFLLIHPFRLEDTEISKTLNYAEDTLQIYTHRQCDCQNNLSFLLTLIAYKCILLTFGLFMAWETRNVTIPILNDSKHIGIAVYAVALVSIVGAISATALSSTYHSEGFYLVVGLSICLCTTITLLLVFFPKITLIYDKNGRDRTQSVSSIISSSSSYHDPCSSRTPLVNRDNAMNKNLTQATTTLPHKQKNNNKRDTQKNCKSRLSSEPCSV